MVCHSSIKLAEASASTRVDAAMSSSVAPNARRYDQCRPLWLLLLLLRRTLASNFALWPGSAPPPLRARSNILMRPGEALPGGEAPRRAQQRGMAGRRPIEARRHCCALLVQLTLAGALRHRRSSQRHSGAHLAFHPSIWAP